MDQEMAASDLATKSRTPIKSGSEYIDSLRNRKLKVYLMGEMVDEPVDHPIIRPSINAVAQTYDLANENPELASAVSPFHRRARQSLSPHLDEPRRSRHAEQDAAASWAVDGHLLPALRRHGCAQLAALRHLRSG